MSAKGTHRFCQAVAALRGAGGIEFARRLARRFCARDGARISLLLREEPGGAEPGPAEPVTFASEFPSLAEAREICKDRTAEREYFEAGSADLCVSHEEEIEFILAMPMNRNQPSHSDPLKNHCNGVVLSAAGEFLAIPPPALVRIDEVTAAVKNNLAEYDIYPALDGSVVTFYHAEGQWKMGTARCADISTKHLMSNVTFREAFHSSAEGTGFAEAALDPAHCYTFVFKHLSHHPLPAPETVRFIRAVNLQTFEVTTESPFPRMEVQRPLSGKHRSVPAIERACRNATNSFWTNKVDICYGYIFRSRSGEAPDYVLESRLMTSVRRFMYRRPDGMVKYIQNIEPARRNEFQALIVYLQSWNSRNEFLKLFSRYKELFTKLDMAMTICVRQVAAVIHGTPMENTYPVLKELAQLILADCPGIEKTNKNLNVVIHGYLYQIEYAPIYWALFMQNAFLPRGGED